METMESITSNKLARIYEMLGLKEDALRIYRAILLENPASKEAQSSIKRLMEIKKHFPPTNAAQKELFINPKSQKDSIKFQRWLREWN